MKTHAFGKLTSPISVSVFFLAASIYMYRADFIVTCGVARLPRFDVGKIIVCSTDGKTGTTYSSCLRGACTYIFVF